MGLPKPAKRYTPQEYYALERDAPYRSEYFNGEIFAMAGGTRKHSRIVANLIRQLGNRLAGSPCEPYDPNLRLRVKATGLLTYPDASVYCGPMDRDLEDKEGETYTNPTVLFEVLSPSTQHYDRMTKSEHYRQIESLRAYVLIWQDEPRAEVRERQPDGRYVAHAVEGLDAVIPLPWIGIELPLAEVYDRVDFTANE